MTTSTNVLAAQLTQIADSYPSKYSYKTRIHFAQKQVEQIIKRNYKNFRTANRELKDAIILNALSIARKQRKMAQTDPKSYTSQPAVNPDAKNKVNEQSGFNLSDCVGQYRAANPGMPESWYHQQCAESLGGNSFRTTALKGETFHQDIGVNSVKSQSSKGPSFSPPLPHLNTTAPTTSAYYGKRKSALQRGREAIAKSDRLLEDMERSKIARTLSASVIAANQQPSTQELLTNPDYQVTGYSLPEDHNVERETIQETLDNARQKRSSLIKNASSKGPSSAWLAAIYRHELKFNRNYAGKLQYEREQAEKKQASRVKSASKTPGYWLKNREHTLSKVAGL